MGEGISRKRWRIAPAIGLALICVAALPGLASAATINVTTITDELDSGFGDTGCSLREAVQAANTNTPFPGAFPTSVCPGDAAGHDTIVLQGGQTYGLAIHDGAPEDGNVRGDLDIEGPVTITTAGSGLATIDAGFGVCPCTNADRAIQVENTAGSVILQRLRIQHGLAESNNGGGGILSDAPLTISNSEIANNGVAATLAFGGGIRVRGPLGSLTMSSSTVAENFATATGGPGSGTQATGGGIMVYDQALSAGITNSTISSNTSSGNANGPGLVGGAFFGDGSPGNQIPTTLTSNTITLNVATAGGAVTGGLQIVAGTMSGNIVAGNSSDNLPETHDCFGSPNSSGGGNLIGKSDQAAHCNFTGMNAGPGDLVGSVATPIPANLGTLIDNGGSTRTHAPNVGSPAINRGGPCPTTDQRGFFRAPVAPCDSGSVEANAPSTLPVLPVTTPPPATPGPTGQRAAALKKCKKKKGKARKKCRRKAQQLPV